MTSRILTAIACLSFPVVVQAAAEFPARLDLPTAIRLAIENNFEIRQARERIRQQEGVVVEISARALPSVTLNGNYDQTSSSLLNEFATTNGSWGVTLNVSQGLYSGGALKAARQNSELTREAAVLDLQAAINNALFNVRRGFYDVLLTRERVAVQEQNVELLRQQLRTATDRFNTGALSSFEKLRAEVGLANAQVPLISARNEARLAVESLRQTLGVGSSSPEASRRLPEVDGTLQYSPLQFELQTALDAARSGRPELQRLAKLVDSAEKAVVVARAGNRPRVNLVGGLQARNGETSSVSAADAGGFIGLQSSWNIFDGRANSGRVRQALSTAEQARLRLLEASLAADVEVRTAFSAFQEGIELAEAAQKVVAQAEEAVRVANSRFETGLATQLDVLQAQVDLTTARTNQVQAYYAYNLAVAQLRKATGTADEFFRQESRAP